MLGILGSSADPFGYYKQQSYVPDVFCGYSKLKIKAVYSWYA